MAYTCPRCQRVTYHPEDARQGWCAACRDFTGQGDVFECGQCGTRFIVPPAHVGSVWCSCLSPEPMHPRRAPREPGLSRGLWQFAAPEPAPEPSLPGAPGAVRAALRYIVERYAPAALAELAAHPDAPWASAAPYDFEAAARQLFCPEESRQNSPGLITGADGEESPGRQEEVDDCPYGDSMRWQPGCAEL